MRNYWLEKRRASYRWPIPCPLTGIIHWTDKKPSSEFIERCMTCIEGFAREHGKVYGYTEEQISKYDCYEIEWISYKG